MNDKENVNKAEPKKYQSEGLKIVGLKEETKKIHDEYKGSPKITHESSLKVPNRTSNSKPVKIYYSIDDFMENTSSNWVEYRMEGKCPERRGYHASFYYNNR